MSNLAFYPQHRKASAGKRLLQELFKIAPRIDMTTLHLISKRRTIARNLDHRLVF
ncbi:hypothetical protein ACSFC1_10415 [Pseudothermotoga sp. U03pept]|uniref:hypothetical protein n=1 Tax=Pseudothermotoga sp. U03pept TaxID=3447012 RepID=UPI003EFE9CDA